MSRRSTLPQRAAAAAVLASLLAACSPDSDAAALPQGRADAQSPARPARYGVGRPATAAEIAAWDIDVAPSGVGLPPGAGTVARGAEVYARQCASCHGARGEGTGKGSTAVPKLVGREPREGFPFGRDLAHVKTVGNYWPHATTVFDYVRRAMPLTAPGTLSASDTYAVVAWMLAENEIVPRDARLDATALRAVRMPAHGRFVRDDRRGGRELR